MKIITLLALMAIMLLAFSGALPKSSVGGAMTLALLYLVAALAVGLHEAWSKKRGVVGWIVSIVASVVGGFLGVNLGNMVLELMLTLLQPEGSLVATGGPLLYVSLAVTMLLTLLGSWIALQIVNRSR
jgi:hypothetical protein